MVVVSADAGLAVGFGGASGHAVGDGASAAGAGFGGAVRAPVVHRLLELVVLLVLELMWCWWQ